MTPQKIIATQREIIQLLNGSRLLTIKFLEKYANSSQTHKIIKEKIQSKTAKNWQEIQRLNNELKEVNAHFDENLIKVNW